MSTTDIARRNGTPPAAQQAALAIRPGQVMWDEFQMAALNQIGLRDASNADRAVFLHQCQRTGLDPFSRQIYMINRQGKWTIQTGIDGWRVTRVRAERREGVTVVLGRAVWYDDEGSEYKVWVRPDPPAACEITLTVDGRPYTSVLLYREYVQTNRDGAPAAQWAVKPAHMLEKCCEADVYRKAFPQDFAGIDLDDAMPPAGDDAPQRQRVTAEQARQRRTVAATVVTPDASPADAQATAAPSASPPSEGSAGEVPAGASSGQRSKIRQEFGRLGYDPDSPDDEQAMLRRTAKLARLGELGNLDELGEEQAKLVLTYLGECGDIAQLDELLDSGEAPGESNG